MLDLIVIGAGAAGIAAARSAQQVGLSFQVLEASHRIGGRAYTEDLAPGVPFDLGCHWLHRANINPLVDEADRLGFTLDRKFMFLPRLWWHGRLSTHEETQAYMAYFVSAETRAEQTLAPDEDRDYLSFIDIDNPNFRPYAHVFSVIHAADPDQVSMRDAMTQGFDGGDWPVREGLGRLVAHLGAEVPVTLNTAVREIDWSARDRVLVRTDRGALEARAVLITVSIGVLQSGMIAFRPTLPLATQEAIDGFSPGVANRTALHFDREVFGDVPSNFNIVRGETEPLAIHIPTFGFNYIVGQTGGRHGAHLTRAGQQASVDHVMDHVAAVFGNDIRKHLARAIVSAWDTDPWVLGAYASVKPGHAGCREQLLEPVADRLFFAGEALAMPMVGTCGGAFFSGARATQRIAGAIRRA